MHTPSFLRLAITGLVASSTVASFDLGLPNGLARRHVGALVALAAPAVAFPAVVIEGRGLETREPHHQGVKTAKKKGKKAKAAKNATAAAVKRDIESGSADLTVDDDEAQELETRSPHHQGVKTTKKKGKKAKAANATAAAVKRHESETDDLSLDDFDVAELETRSPHHQGVKTAKKKGKKAKAAKNATAAAVKRDIESRSADLTVDDDEAQELETRSPHHQGVKTTKKKGKKGKGKTAAAAAAAAVKRDESDDCDDATVEDVEEAQIETRSPHHQGVKTAKKKGKKAKGKNAAANAGVAV